MLVVYLHCYSACMLQLFIAFDLHISVVAKRFCSEYGCVRLSIGEVLRRILTKFPDSRLAELIESHLKSGLIVPDDLCMYALESALLDFESKTRG